MIKSQWFVYGLFGMSLVSMGFFSGCATSGFDRSERTSRSMVVVDAEIRTMINNIDRTAKSLDTMINSSEQDLKKNYNQFRYEVIEMEKQGTLVIRREEEMTKLSKDYFTEWELQGNQYTNAQIKELSEERRTKLAGIYNQFTVSNLGLKTSYLSYISSLKELEMFISTDLTPSGIKAIGQIGDRTVTNLLILRKSLQPVVSAINEINVELYGSKK